MCAQNDKTIDLMPLVLEDVILILVCDRVLKELKTDPLDIIMRDFVKGLRSKTLSRLKNYI